MATRRRYKDGGVVHHDNSSPDVARPAQEVQPAASPVDDDPIKSGLESMRYAEAMQRQQAQAQPALSQAKLRFLDQHPRYKLPHISELAKVHYQSGLAAGMPDDSDELFAHIARETDADIDAINERHRRAKPMPPDQHRAQRADELEREAAQQMADMAPPAATKQAPQRSMPISAPVSRTIPSASGGSVPMRITLSPEERDMARKSYSDLPPEAAERLYSDMKRRMLIARANGTLNE
jgi:hypothetical protein